MKRVKGAKSLEGIPWTELVYYDESSSTFLRHNREIRYGNQDTLIRAKKGDEAGNPTLGGYTSLVLSRYGTFPIHRIVWYLNTGEDVPPNQLIDHIDGNRTNNCISNLRLIPEAENTRNTSMYSNNTTGVTGVYFDKKKYPNSNEIRNYWKASWMELDGNQKTKAFSIEIFGLLPAFKMAVEYRQAQIERLNREGAGYTERHGKER